MDGHNVSIKAGEPSPKCQRESCHRRAQFMYTSRVSGLRVFRPWCRVCRPNSSVRVNRPTPRKYHPAGEAWPPDIRCPHCHRAREPRADGERRAVCRVHRHLAPATAPRTTSAPVPRPKPIIRRRKPSPPPVPPSAPTFAPFVYHEGKRREEIMIPKRDQRWLRELFQTDTGHYVAATYSRLSRRYPTAAISELWAQWASLQE